MAIKRKWIIYMYTFPNGKRYIGKTSTSLKERQGSNWTGYRQDSVLMKAVRKYGVENIEQEIIFENLMTDENASRLEQLLILSFKTNCLRFTNPAYGYNMTDGGEGAPGYRHDDNTKRRMSESKKNRTGDNANRSKPLYCVELYVIFPNGVYAEEVTSVSRKAISWALHNKKNKNTNGGITDFDVLHWEFAEKKPRLQKKVGPAVKQPRVVKCKRIYCIELDKYFESVNHAHNEGYGAISTIRSCCNGNSKRVVAKNGQVYHWLYEDDVNECNIREKLLEIDESAIYCIELDMYFTNVDEAERMGYGKRRNIMESYRGVSKFTKLPDGTKVHWLRAKDVCEENIYNVLNNNL